MRSQVEAKYAQQQDQTQQQDTDKLKPKPGERVVTMRGKKVVKTETVPYPNQKNGALRPRAGERVVTMTSSGRVLRTEIVPQQPAKPTLATYARQAEKLIADAGSDARERNRAITGAYASLYMQKPEAFAWLGAAAYASGQVGYAIDTLDTASATGVELPMPISGTVLENAAAVRKMMTDGNITIYRNVYPISLAYKQGGIQELRRLESTLKGEQLKQFIPLREAYEQIDKGVKLNKRASGAGDMLITDGTNAIIDFEQRVIAQPLFDRNPKLVYAMGQFAFGDLDADDSHTDERTYSSFRTNHLLQNFGNPDTRVDWIKNEIFVKWDEHRTQRRDEVRGQMFDLILAGQAAGGRY